MSAFLAVGIPGTETDVYRSLERLAQEGKLAERLLAALRGFSDSFRWEPNPSQNAARLYGDNNPVSD